jgi:hypothetical protein
MAFQKGNALGGRKVGSVGKSNAKTKEAFTLLLNNNLSKLQSDLDNLESKDRLKIMLELASYVIPKLRSVESEIEVKQAIIPTINFTTIEA